MVSDSMVSYWYEGLCPASGDLLKLPRTVFVEAIARDLMQELATDAVYNREGKMYGVLLVELPTGERQVLKAFSGLLNAYSVIAGWVPPIPGREEVAVEEAHTLAELEAIKQELITLKELRERQQDEILSYEFEQQLQQMNNFHRNSKQERDTKRRQYYQELTGEALTTALAQLEEKSRQQGIERRQLKAKQNAVLQPLQQLIAAADKQIQELKQRRKALSRQLQAQMHAAYSLMNFLGQSASLQQLMPAGSIPTGTGDCCAPKLLHYAANNGFKPLAMAEFWWGESLESQDKVQGEFYGACVERCQPLMGFLLSGFKSPFPAPGRTTKSSLSSNFNDRGGLNLPDFSRDLENPSPNLSPARREALNFPPSLPGKGVRGLGFALAFPHNVTSQINLPIIYEDEWLIAVNKPPGLLSVPGRYRDTQDSVLSRWRYWFPDDTEIMTVHRLDQETSGILLLTRDRQVHRQLSQQFQQRQIHKIYEAILSGAVTVDQGVIELPLWGNPENRPYQQVNWQHGKPSLTKFRVIDREGNYPRVEFIPLTGRTHQLRVHAADQRGLGITILGDRLYGCNAVTSRLHLHARELRFEHPQLGKTLHLQAKTPF
ncbi:MULTISPECIES: RluA family pseudouridine synthase [unclassified Nodularia (in: cyanobacteria)]|uniref:RluA family pseudouridine synthase n=1 Tax=unclassified Nodularia (in: cyanobacteria) TaxID=2656917 RepID=UPI00187EE6FB|nr:MULTISPECIES: RluA family pseudouridine synthase [unclassified Nodularia (in: cyanobacteria)]MBE9201148.1 RluA family pseudouridine synthase [Nodularia sp. LEGE 06071]MCC2695431.1 RluA family pseudouridine synthase [Nodularia sp. LEGE 04288]